MNIKLANNEQLTVQKGTGSESQVLTRADADGSGTVATYNSGGKINQHRLPDKVEEIVWDKLVSKKYRGELVPGTWYRITDFCTLCPYATEEEYQSAEYPFDIMVFAETTTTLNENAFAIQHNGDDYFNTSNLAAWELKYCLENDTDRFLWAFNERVFPGLNVPVMRLSRNNANCRWLIRSYAGDNDDDNGQCWVWFDDFDGEDDFSVAFGNSGFPGFVTKEYLDNPTNGVGLLYTTYDDHTDTIVEFDSGLWHVDMCSHTGRGVIYYMKDEWGNEAPYDFKNIMFSRYFTQFPNTALFNKLYVVPLKNHMYGENETSLMEQGTDSAIQCFTFSRQNELGYIIDGSIKYDYQGGNAEFGMYDTDRNVAANNKIESKKYCIVGFDEGNAKQVFGLPNIVIMDPAEQGESSNDKFSYRVSDNYFGQNCSDLTLCGDIVSNNRFTGNVSACVILSLDNISQVNVSGSFLNSFITSPDILGLFIPGSFVQSQIEGYNIYNLYFYSYSDYIDMHAVQFDSGTMDNCPTIKNTYFYSAAAHSIIMEDVDITNCKFLGTISGFWCRTAMNFYFHAYSRHKRGVLSNNIFSGNIFNVDVIGDIYNSNISANISNTVFTDLLYCMISGILKYCYTLQDERFIIFSGDIQGTDNEHYALISGSGNGSVNTLTQRA